MLSEEREQRATDALNDSAAEIGEEAVAVLTGMDILEHIPIAKLGVAAFRAAQTIRDHCVTRRWRCPVGEPVKLDNACVAD